MGTHSLGLLFLLMDPSPKEARRRDLSIGTLQTYHKVQMDLIVPRSDLIAMGDIRIILATLVTGIPSMRTNTPLNTNARYKGEEAGRG